MIFFFQIKLLIFHLPDLIFLKTPKGQVSTYRTGLTRGRGGYKNTLVIQGTLRKQLSGESLVSLQTHTTTKSRTQTLHLLNTLNTRIHTQRLHTLSTREKKKVKLLPKILV